MNSSGVVQNYVTDARAELAGTAQTNMQSLLEVGNGTTTPLTDGQVVYVVETYFQSPDLSVGSLSGNGVYARYFFYLFRRTCWCKSAIVGIVRRAPLCLWPSPRWCGSLSRCSGLVVDLGILYSAKARLQAAVDGAALAAARALNLGQTTTAQAASAQQNAVNWFYANFPAGNWATRIL